MFDCMNSIFSKISQRRAAIAEQIASLEEEDKLWEQTYRGLYFKRQLSLDQERVEARTAKKLAVLAMVSDEIELKLQNKQSGATLKQIRARVEAFMPDLPENTLRSYLSRFRAEGHLEHNEKNSRWMLPNPKEGAPE